MIIVLTTPQLVIYYTHGRDNTHHYSQHSNSRRMVWGTMGTTERSTFSLSYCTVRSIQRTHDGYQSHGHQPRTHTTRTRWTTTVGSISAWRPSIIKQGGITGAWPGASSHSLYSRHTLHIVLVVDPGIIITTTMPHSGGTRCSPSSLGNWLLLFGFASGVDCLVIPRILTLWNNTHKHKSNKTGNAWQHWQTWSPLTATTPRYTYTQNKTCRDCGINMALTSITQETTTSSLWIMWDNGKHAHHNFIRICCGLSNWTFK